MSKRTGQSQVVEWLSRVVERSAGRKGSGQLSAVSGQQRIAMAVTDDKRETAAAMECDWLIAESSKLRAVST